MYLDKLQKDDVFPTSKLISLKELTGYEGRKGMDKALLSGNKIVNVVSKSYGHLPNEQFFLQVEEALINADINYKTRSINRDNRSFAVDYIFADESYHINVKSNGDKLIPMLRFINSYDGSCKTSGSFGFFRQICSNGLHVATTKVEFSCKHRGDVVNIVLPEIKAIVDKFMNNEFFSLHKKFEVLAETPITNINDFVEITAKATGLFQFEKSQENDEPSLNARTVIETIERESNMLHIKPNYWLGYNALNELLHGKLKKSFADQKRIDAKLFNTVLELAN